MAHTRRKVGWKTVETAETTATVYGLQDNDYVDGDDGYEAVFNTFQQPAADYWLNIFSS